MRDDGAGFDPQRRSTGFGLAGMGERLALVRGTLEVRTAPGGGTTLRAAIGQGQAVARVSSVAAPRGTTITGQWALRISRPLTPPMSTARSGP